MKLSIPAKAYSENKYLQIFFIDLIMGDKHCHRTYLDEVFRHPIMPRGRHKKFSSVGNNLTKGVYKGRTYITKERPIEKIAIHCTATPLGRDLGAHDIDNMHINRWGANSGCGYHYIIKIDGTIEKGRWADNPGAHVKGYNQKSIGIAYIGGVDNKLNSVEDAATPQQMESLSTLVNLLAEKYSLAPDDILGHREFPDVYKACPCLTMDRIRRDMT